MYDTEAEPGTLERQWWVSCAVCEDAIRLHGPNQVDAMADAREQGWKTKGGRWVCSNCAKPAQKSRKLVFTNNFHNTAAAVIAKPAGHGRHQLTGDQVARAYRQLCGMADCQCTDQVDVADLDGKAWELREYNGGYFCEPREV